MKMNRILEEDCAYVAESSSVDWNRLSGKVVLITGATGLIGSSLLRTISMQTKGLALALRWSRSFATQKGLENYWERG